MNAALLVLSSALAAGGDVTPAGWGEKPPVIVQAGGCSNCGPAAAPAYAGPCCESTMAAQAGRVRLIDRLKGCFGNKSSTTSMSSHCDPCATAPVAAPRLGLFDKLKARLGGKSSSSSHAYSSASPCTMCGCGPVVGGPAHSYPGVTGPGIVGTPGCASPLPLGAVPVTPITPGTPVTLPKDMPKPRDPNEKPKVPVDTSKDPVVKPKVPVEQPKVPVGGSTGNIAPLPSVVEPVTLPPLPISPIPAPGTGSTSPY